MLEVKPGPPLLQVYAILLLPHSTCSPTVLFQRWREWGGPPVLSFKVNRERYMYSKDRRETGLENVCAHVHVGSICKLRPVISQMGQLWRLCFCHSRPVPPSIQLKSSKEEQGQACSK